RLRADAQGRREVPVRDRHGDVGGSVRRGLRQFPSRVGGGKLEPIVQYVARPPLKSNTAPVVNEFSSLASQVIMDAASLSSSMRPRGILLTIMSRNFGSWLIAMVVLATAGVTQLTPILYLASSLPSDLVSAMTPAFIEE